MNTDSIISKGTGIKNVKTGGDSIQFVIKEKSLKKVLTNGEERGIITKLSHEAADEKSETSLNKGFWG